MKHFYGYERRLRDAPEGMDRVWIDDPATHRQERHDMMLATSRDADWPEGHDIYVLALGDLGKGVEAKAIREAIEAEGNRLHVVDVEPQPDRRGRPRDFDPDPEQDKKIERLYRSYNAMRYVLDRVEEIMGERFAVHHLKRRYGNRWKKPTPETPEDDDADH